MTHQLFVNEVFGPTFQGEGPSMGRRCHFLRLGLCNLKCTWCDTAYTWDWTGQSDMAKRENDGLPYIKGEQAVGYRPEDTLERLQALGTAPLLVVSGGEPLLQARALHETLNYISHGTAYTHIEIETNGTVSPGTLKFISSLSFNVSPKLVGSGNNERARRRWDVLAEFAATHKARFKFVLRDEADLDEAVFLVSALGIDASRVWAMPEGTDAPAIQEGMQAMAQSILNVGWNLSTRMHVLMWGNERGK